MNPGTIFQFNKLQVTIESFVAAGGFSSVYIVKSEGNTFIMKRSSVPPDPAAYQSAVHEIEILVFN
jgi:hypothetical protein